jgi:hypothetical protein
MPVHFFLRTCGKKGDSVDHMGLLGDIVQTQVITENELISQKGNETLEKQRQLDNPSMRA